MEGYHRVGYNPEPAPRIRYQVETEVSYQPVSRNLARTAPVYADDSVNEELTTLQNFKIKPVKQEVYS